jgi:glycosyltransferase involved in cell wall biosynthesis
MKVVRNVPFYIDQNLSDKNQKNGIKYILYQGSLNVGRGLEHIIDAMQFIDNVKLKIIGDGDITEQLKERILDKGLTEKIELKGRIPFEDLPAETAKADLGIALEENIGLNYYYALPNKLFDYIQAGVPVLVSSFPEMQKIVNKYEIGTVYDHKDPESLAQKISEIFKLENRYTKWKENTFIAAKELCWENEEKVLVQVYSQTGLKFE